MVSTSSSAGWPALSIARRTSGMRGDAGGSLVMHDAHGLDRVARVGAQAPFDFRVVRAMAPVARDEVDLEAELARHLVPERGKVAGLGHEDAIARGERVQQRRFPRARAGCGIDDHGMARLEDAL